MHSIFQLKESELLSLRNIPQTSEADDPEISTDVVGCMLSCSGGCMGGCYGSCSGSCRGSCSGSSA